MWSCLPKSGVSMRFAKLEVRRWRPSEPTAKGRTSASPVGRAAALGVRPDSSAKRDKREVVDDG